MAGRYGLWKTIVLPPLFALLLYILAIYLFLPAYHRLRARHRSSSAYFRSQIPSWLLLPSISPGSRRFSGESLLGDEELEEGLLEDDVPGRPNDPDIESRLSRELEVGFKDESDEEEGMMRG
ncbi:hypothetical protein MMC31_000528 [Peltigera leucophlebia]|nr:hypothetical protein [Peltigera leucophlebia]